MYVLEYNENWLIHNLYKLQCKSTWERTLFTAIYIMFYNKWDHCSVKFTKYLIINQPHKSETIVYLSLMNHQRNEHCSKPENESRHISIIFVCGPDMTITIEVSVRLFIPTIRSVQDVCLVMDHHHVPTTCSFCFSFVRSPCEIVYSATPILLFLLDHLASRRLIGLHSIALLVFQALFSLCSDASVKSFSIYRTVLCIFIQWSQ